MATTLQANTTTVEAVAVSGAETLAPSAPALMPVAKEACTEEALTQAAHELFGYAALRGLQLPVLQSVLAGRSTLAIMPTGLSDFVNRCMPILPICLVDDSIGMQLPACLMQL